MIFLLVLSAPLLRRQHSVVPRYNQRLASRLTSQTGHNSTTKTPVLVRSPARSDYIIPPVAWFSWAVAASRPWNVP
jgi:hypothetical protein